MFGTSTLSQLYAQITFADSLIVYESAWYRSMDRPGSTTASIAKSHAMRGSRSSNKVMLNAG